MIREERDPAFWERIARHPACAESLAGVDPREFAEMAVTHMLPLAATHGGFLFVPCAGWARVVELHTLFTPEGWGREAARAGKEALGVVFDRYDLVVTYEQVGAWRTQPPRSFGFKVCGEEFEMHGHKWRTWEVSKEQWRASASYQRQASAR